jgi:hypothetical protein
MTALNILPNPEADRAQQGLRRVGHRLADTRWKDLCEGLTGDRRAWTAILLENQYGYVMANRPQFSLMSEGANGVLTETTKLVNIGGWDKAAFGVIRAAAPNFVVNDIATVQPMTVPVTLVFYLDFLMGTTKGNQTSGTAIMDARTGPANTKYYSSAVVPQEAFAASGDPTGNLAFTPVRPGTVTGSYTHTSGATTVTFTDDGNGNLVSSNADLLASTITYSNGNFAVNSTANVDANSLKFTYEYDTEANTNIPEINIQITGAPVAAVQRKMKSQYSMEAAQNLQALHGIDAQTELMGVMSDILKFEVDREVIDDLFNFAQAGNVQWDKTVPAGIGWAEHKLSFEDSLIANSNQVFSATRRVHPNWAVAGTDVCTVIESLPKFEAVAGGLSTQGTAGVVKIGTLGSRWTLYKDPYFTSAAKWVIGFKGTSLYDAGYIYAPYVPLYMTNPITLEDFMTRQGVGTQYGKKAVNSKFYATGEVLNP